MADPREYTFEVRVTTHEPLCQVVHDWIQTVLDERTVKTVGVKVLGGTRTDPANPLKSKCRTHDNQPGCECCGGDLFISDGAKRVHDQALCGECVIVHDRGDFGCECPLPAEPSNTIPGGA